MENSANNFIYYIDNDEERVMHSKIDNIEIMINDEVDEVMKEIFDSLKNRYQNNLESMKGSEFVFDYVHLLYYIIVDKKDWIKNKKAIINTINKKDRKCFHYEEIKKDSQRITKIRPFVNKYNWEGINFSSEKDDWKKIEKSNLIIALNVLYAKKEKYFLLMFQNITQIVKNRLSF